MELTDRILVSQVNHVIMQQYPSRRPVGGTLCITSYHLILSARERGNDELIIIMHNMIDIVEKKLSNITGGSLSLKCKDFRVVKLDISSTEDLNNVATTLESLSSINSVLLMYPFFYRLPPSTIEDGWTAYRPESEFTKLTLGDDWRLTYINQNFDICPTYPSVLVVPKSMDDDTIILSAKFREGGRFPVLSYRHNVGSVLMRSSQPLVGSTNKRCKEDERLLNSVLGIGKRGFIIDTRASNSKSRNGGYELQAHYPQWRRLPKPIERHHVLLDSLSKIVEACIDKSSSMDKWSSRLESSNWLSHVRDALNCACLTAQCLDQDVSPVLVHGSEGTDSTLVITSVVQVILNPDCRTMRGFQALIEREWLQAGYPFQKRHSRGCFSTTSTGRTKSHGATFLLFLDCVWQIQNQFICSFEFSPSLLYLLFEHSYASEYGTFLGNCEADRDMLELPQKTVSLWSYINKIDVLETLLNPLYLPNNKIIWPSVAPMSLILWRELFLRWTVDLSNERDAQKKIEKIVKKNKELKSKVIQLRKQLTEYSKQT
ncbi:hypothetical protein V9T40_007212 [Parthenolecanium corni]|uniref:Myotubularin phosphatase domain-containing protein n=1 Tax=Parthenolecanium corni TaxID=536013 RepID=A0AAN9U3B6_9HEMI